MNKKYLSTIILVLAGTLLLSSSARLYPIKPEESLGARRVRDNDAYLAQIRNAMSYGYSLEKAYGFIHALNDINQRIEEARIAGKEEYVELFSSEAEYYEAVLSGTLHKYWLKEFRRFKNASDDLPEELISSNGFYKARSSYLVGLSISLGVARKEGILAGDEMTNLFNEFFAYGFNANKNLSKDDRRKFTTQEEIDYMNETLDKVIAWLEQVNNAMGYGYTLEEAQKFPALAVEMSQDDASYTYVQAVVGRKLHLYYIDLFTHLHDDYIDDLPEETIEPNDPNLSRYKARGNYISELKTRLTNLLKEGLVTDKGVLEKVQAFVAREFGAERGERLTTEDEIESMNEITEEVIYYLEITFIAKEYRTPRGPDPNWNLGTFKLGHALKLEEQGDLHGFYLEKLEFYRDYYIDAIPQEVLDSGHPTDRDHYRYKIRSGFLGNVRRTVESAIRRGVIKDVAMADELKRDIQEIIQIHLKYETEQYVAGISAPLNTAEELEKTNALLDKTIAHLRETYPGKLVRLTDEEIAEKYNLTIEGVRNLSRTVDKMRKGETRYFLPIVEQYYAMQEGLLHEYYLDRFRYFKGLSDDLPAHKLPRAAPHKATGASILGVKSSLEMVVEKGIIVDPQLIKDIEEFLAYEWNFGQVNPQTGSNKFTTREEINKINTMLDKVIAYLCKEYEIN